MSEQEILLLTQSDPLKLQTENTKHGWSKRDILLIELARELNDDIAVSDFNWDVLSEFFNPKQLLDAMAAVAQYRMLAMMLYGLKIPVDIRWIVMFRSSRSPTDCHRSSVPTKYCPP
jgi:hypothetical protein